MGSQMMLLMMILLLMMMTMIMMMLMMMTTKKMALMMMMILLLLMRMTTMALEGWKLHLLRFMESRHTPIERPPMLGFKQSEIFRFPRFFHKYIWFLRFFQKYSFLRFYLVEVLWEIDFGEVLSGSRLMNEILATKNVHGSCSRLSLKQPLFSWSFV